MIVACCAVAAISSPIKVGCRLKKFEGKDGCFLKKIEIRSDSAILKFETTSKTTIKALHIQNEIVNFLPPSLFSDFKQLELLHVVGSGLKSVTKKTFKTAGQIIDLNFENNDLVELNFDTFSDLTKLKTLNLAQNKISSIHSKLFASNTDLQSLLLSFNSIDKVHENTFKKLTKLEILDLSNNKIVELREETFKFNIALIKVDISDNLLEFLPETLFEPTLTLLEDLKLRNNKCLKDDAKFVSATNGKPNFNLIRDILVENCLPHHYKQCRDEFKDEKIQLEKRVALIQEEKNSSEQKLNEEIHELKSKASQLEKDLEKNKTSLRLEEEQLKRLMFQLTELQTENEELKSDNKSASKMLTAAIDKLNMFEAETKEQNKVLITQCDEHSVKNTDLSKKNNQLKEEILSLKKASDKCAQFDITCDLPVTNTCKARGVVAPFETMELASCNVANIDKIRSLDISEAFVTFLPATVFEKFRHLTQLEIINSKLRHINRGSFTAAKNLERLTVMKNIISHIPNFAFEGADNLQFLKLDSNEIQTLSENSFSGLGNLVELTLRINEITEIPANIFDSLTNLKNLQLTRNKLEHLHDRTLLMNNYKLEILTISKNPLVTIDAHLLDHCLLLKEVFYGLTKCIQENVKADKIETFRNDVNQHCSV